jgi:glycosyltransferase involved in cell wall biosynthesis
VHVIRNAVVRVEITPEERSALRKCWGSSDEGLVVGCVGNFLPGKGHELLLDVAAALRHRHRNVVFCFVGDGPLRTLIEDGIAARKLEEAVVLHSRDPDARRLYGAFDIAVQASASEGLPNVVLEAAAAGLPIVATAVGGTAEILTSEHDGLLVAKGDRDGIIKAIGRLLAEPSLRRRFGLAAQARARAFSPERLADETGSLYLRLLAAKTGGRRAAVGR